MNARKVFLLLTFLTFSWAASIERKIEWPLGKCSRIDPKLNECILKLAKKAIPSIIKGNDLLEIPRLDPLKIGNYTLRVNKQPVTLNFSLVNATLIGAGNVSINSVSFNKKSNRMQMVGFHKELTVIGNYAMSGKLFVVPINTKGKMQLLFKNILANHTIEFIPKVLRGEKFLGIRIIFKFIKVDFLKTTLKNPSTSPAASNTLNKLLNDNWKLVFKAFTPSVEKMIEVIFTRAFEPMFSKFSYDELLPPK